MRALLANQNWANILNELQLLRDFDYWPLNGSSTVAKILQKVWEL